MRLPKFEMTHLLSGSGLNLAELGVGMECENAELGQLKANEYLKPVGMQQRSGPRVWCIDVHIVRLMAGVSMRLTLRTRTPAVAVE